MRLGAQLGQAINRKRKRESVDRPLLLRGSRCIENIMLGRHQTNLILAGEITAQAATLHAHSTNFSNHTPQRAATVVMSGGRQRHLIFFNKGIAEIEASTNAPTLINLKDFIAARASANGDTSNNIEKGTQ